MTSAAAAPPLLRGRATGREPPRGRAWLKPAGRPAERAARTREGLTASRRLRTGWLGEASWQ